MQENINTRTYWENRFQSGDWASKKGRSQTANFAKGQIPHLQMAKDFDGTILDFGCGLGDAMPIYRENFPKARLMGMDISQSAIDQCRKKYGSIATFMQGEYDAVPDVDVIISSNVFEHLTDDLEIAKHLYSKCRSLYIVVPYKEWPLISEHVNSYDEKYYSDIGKCDFKVFCCRGWTPFGIRGLWYQIYIKNVLRYFLRQPLRNRNMQIIFHFSNF